MKVLVVFALFAAVGTAQPAGPQSDRILNIIGSMLSELFRPPISVGPAIIEGSPISVGPPIIVESPISVGPAIVDEESPISVGPAIVEEESPISVGPAIVEEANPTPVSPFAIMPIFNSPLVNIILNVNGFPIEGSPVEKPEIEPTPVIVVEKPEIEPTPVIVVEKPEIESEPVIVAPIQPAPVVVLPDTLN